MTLLINHYHILGYLKNKENLGPFMQRLHGSVAKLVNDLLPQRHLPFWRSKGNKDYFDGCLRDVLQGYRSYDYTKLQAVRAGVVSNVQDYLDTKVYIEKEVAIAQAVRDQAFLEDLPY